MLGLIFRSHQERESKVLVRCSLEAEAIMGDRPGLVCKSYMGTLEFGFPFPWMP